MSNLPHIISFYSSWIEGTAIPITYIQLQYCSRGTLASIAAYRRNNNIPWIEQELLYILGQLCIAIHSLHARHISHVDIKPENILFDNTYSLILSDFGNAIFDNSCESKNGLVPNSIRNSSFSGLNSQYYQENTLANNEFVVPANDSFTMKASPDEGDFRYCPLDLLEGSKAFMKSDIFSAGMTILELASNAELPNGDNSFKEVRSPGTAKQILTERGYSTTLSTIIESMLHIVPIQRPSALDLLNLPLFGISNVSYSLNNIDTSLGIDLDVSIDIISEQLRQIAYHKLQATILEIQSYLINLKLHPPRPIEHSIANKALSPIYEQKTSIAADKLNCMNNSGMHSTIIDPMWLSAESQSILVPSTHSQYHSFTSQANQTKDTNCNAIEISTSMNGYNAFTIEPTISNTVLSTEDENAVSHSPPPQRLTNYLPSEASMNFK